MLHEHPGYSFLSGNKKIHQQVLDVVMKQLIKEVVPWQNKKIKHQSFNQIPVNFKTEIKYSGINVLLLWIASSSAKYPCNEWAGRCEWEEAGEQIKPKERGSLIVNYQTTEKVIGDNVYSLPALKPALVFNRCQLGHCREAKVKHNIRQPLSDIADRLEDFVVNTKAMIEIDHTRSGYDAATDIIRMISREDFITTDRYAGTDEYYSTLMHELIHWTGHRSRLHRTLSKDANENSDQVEELIAGLGAAFLCADLSIADSGKFHSASFWQSLLLENKYCLLGAATEASKAADYILSLQ